MTRLSSARRERFLPYRYARGGVQLTVTSCKLDGDRDVAPDVADQRLDLDGPWADATLRVCAGVAAPTFAAIGEGEPPEAFEIALVLRCPATFVRRAVTVELGVVGGTVERSLALRRDDLSGSASLVAYLVRKRAHTARPALVRGARLAESRAWEVRIDPPREHHGEYLDVRYKKFSEDETLPLRDRGNLYVLDVDQESPILWINADHQRVAGILDSRGVTGRAARLRESFFDHVAYAVWSQLFVKATTDLLASDDDETTYPWQDVVLDALLGDVFPEVKGGSARRRRLREWHADLPELWRRLDAALQRRNDLASHLAKLAEEEVGS